MNKKIALPLILATALGLGACHKADTSADNGTADMNMTTNDAVADVNAAAADASMNVSNDTAAATNMSDASNASMGADNSAMMANSSK